MRRAGELIYRALFWLLVGVALSIVIGALLIPLPAQADAIAQTPDGTRTVRLTRESCPAVVLALLPEDTRGYYLRAYTRIDGVSYIACWVLQQDGQVYLRYEDGDGGLLDAVEFVEANPT